MCLINLPADADGMPLAACSAPDNEDERKRVGKMIKTVALKIGKAVRPSKNVRSLAADKGCDDDALRNFLKKKPKLRPTSLLFQYHKSR